MTKVTITELAKHLGVSVCTVNKALSGKAKVSEKTRQRIIDEASRLGYRPNRMAQVLARNPIRLAYIHPADFPSFFNPFETGVGEEVGRLAEQRVTAQYFAIAPSNWNEQLRSVVESLVSERIAGLILSPLSGIDYEPIWRLLAAHRIPLVQLGLEIPGSPAALTVRQDAFLSGRIAAELLSHFPGPAAVMIGKRQSADSIEKLHGFQTEAAKRGLAIAEVYEHRDDLKLSNEMTHQLFHEHPEIGGLYVATDNCSGIFRGIEQEGRVGRVRVVATGVFPEIRGAMDKNLVQFSLDQRMTEQGVLAVKQLHELLSQRPLPSDRLLIPPRIAVRGNIELLASQATIT
jgi:LacI family transcriptional regulator